MLAYLVQNYLISKMCPRTSAVRLAKRHLTPIECLLRSTCFDLVPKMRVGRTVKRLMLLNLVQLVPKEPRWYSSETLQQRDVKSPNSGLGRFVGSMYPPKAGAPCICVVWTE